MTTPLFRRILVPHDFSDAADQALALAAALASEHGGQLVVLNVLEPVSVPRDVALPNNPMPHLFDFVPMEEKALRARVRRVLGRPAPPTAVTVEIGVPFRCILEAAREADCIVMSTHGRTGLRHLLMGSVAERVLRLSPVPVLTMHPTTPAAAAAPHDTRPRAS